MDRISLVVFLVTMLAAVVAINIFAAENHAEFKAACAAAGGYVEYIGKGGRLCIRDGLIVRIEN